MRYQSFATVTQINIVNAETLTGKVDIGYSGSNEAVSKDQAPVGISNFTLDGDDVSGGVAS